MLCTPITGKKEIATLSIDTKSQKVRWQGSSNQNTYNLQNGVFGYTQTKPDSKFHVRHSLNRYSGILTVEAYDFDIDNNCAEVMSNFKICLVSPSRWGLQDMVDSYLDKFKNFTIKIDAIMIENDEKFTN